MKLSKVKIAALLFVIILVVGLTIWTVTSPPILTVQSNSQLGNSLFSYSKSIAVQNFTDGSGAYAVKFGFDYSTNVSKGEQAQLAVYCALTNEQISSSFTRGVGLILQSATLAIDGRQDSGIMTSSRFQPGLQIFYIQNVDTNIALGSHNLTARLIVSNIDVNYIGNSVGSTQVIILSGVMNVTG